MDPLESQSDESQFNKGKVYSLDKLVPYQVAWQWQRQLVNLYKASIAAAPGPELCQEPVTDVLMLLQHPSVYTLGQGSDTKFLRFDPDNTDNAIHRVERGGEVTYHCPGQLVGYPILNLKNYRPD